MKKITQTNTKDEINEQKAAKLIHINDTIYVNFLYEKKISKKEISDIVSCGKKHGKRNNDFFIGSKMKRLKSSLISGFFVSDYDFLIF
jgi:hypothetical protein